jgi:diguanylate cyclase (GGDEF)-like protein
MIDEKNKYHTLLENFPDPVIILDRENNISTMNLAAGELLREIQSPREIDHELDPTRKIISWLANELTIFSKSKDLGFSFEKDIETSKGTIPFQVRLKRMFDENEKFIGCMVILNDLTTLKQEFEYVASHDPLTGLPSRHMLEESLKRAVARAKRGVKSSLLFIRADNLKSISDSRTLKIGNDELISLGNRLKNHLRESDLLARIGGDKFGILLEGTYVWEAQEVEERLRAAAEELYFTIDNVKYKLSLSVALVSIDEKNEPEVLMSKAEIALSQAREKGRKLVIVD